MDTSQPVDVSAGNTIPCATCPWRVGSSAADIPAFDIAKARGLRSTVGEGDQFRTVMACHGSACGAESPCIGYIAVEGYSNINVRLMALDGRINLPQIWEAAERLDLYQSFDEMLANLEETHTEG